jgi:hypothetical protein
MAKRTSIRMNASTRDRLARLKSNPRETYDELLRKLMALIPEGDEEGRFTDAFRAGLLNARLDVRSGRMTGHAGMKKRLGP